MLKARCLTPACQQCEETVTQPYSAPLPLPIRHNYYTTIDRGEGEGEGGGEGESERDIEGGIEKGGRK